MNKPQIIKVTVKNNQQVVSARDLHNELQLKKRFSAWVAQNFKSFEQGTDFEGVLRSTPFNPNYPDGRHQEIQDYVLTLDMAKELCMMSHTERGKQVRRYFIQLEKKWNDPKEVVKRGYEILQSENAQLRLENQQMKPKALFADAVSTSNTSILIGQLAKIKKQNGVDIGQNRLFTWMRENGYLGKRGQNYNRPTQMAMNMGLLEVKERTVNNPDGSVRITFTTMVTGKGQQYFINKFLGDHKMAE